MIRQKLQRPVEVEGCNLTLQRLFVEVVKERDTHAGFWPLQRSRPPTTLQELSIVTDRRAPDTAAEAQPDAVDSVCMYHPKVGISSGRVQTGFAIGMSELNCKVEPIQVLCFEV